ncbi:hypothetical protein ACJMK2_004634 [Sinanodonta woodiana]|uniref:DUF19 domain-containing protein n=1 Tax=Sinanodonta woodiana TaxID=1069815 RepID=A0ABD3Y2W9_SINWO
MLMIVLYAFYVGQSSSLPTLDQHELGKKRSACSDFLLHTYSAQMCSSALGLLNGTIYSQADVCSMFDETLNCVQKSLKAEGGTCNLRELETAYKHTARLAGLPPLIQSCQASQLNGSFCDSTQRLGELIFVACNPYFSQMSMFPSITCSYVEFLKTCVKTATQLLNESCSESQIDHALASSVLDSRVRALYPSVQFNECFHHDGPTNSRCGITVAMPLEATRCISFLANVNFSLPEVTQARSCSLFSEVLSCMRRVYLNEGSTCTLDVLRSTVISFGELSQADWLPVEKFKLCTVYESFSNTSLCRSNSRLLDILFYVGKSLLESLNLLPVSFQCQVLEMVTNTTLIQINTLSENCVKVDLIRAMTSTVAKEKFQIYPNIHINECVHSHTD